MINLEGYIYKLTVFASKAHEGQIRRDGKPYFECHVLRVAAMARILAHHAGYEIQKVDLCYVLALLHDVCEDCRDYYKNPGKMEADIVAEMGDFEGLSEICEMVETYLTKTWTATYSEYIEKILSSDIDVVKLVKLADNKINMKDCWYEISNGKDLDRATKSLSKYLKHYQEVYESVFPAQRAS